MDGFTSSHWDMQCIGSTLPEGRWKLCRLLDLLVSFMGKQESHQGSTCPLCTHLHKEKAAALAGISSWRRKTVFCNACAPWCRQIRSLWLSTGLRKTTYRVTDRRYLHQCTKQHQELLPGDGAHLMTDCQPAADQHSVLHIPAHYSSPTQPLSMIWMQQEPGNSPSKLLLHSSPLYEGQQHWQGLIHANRL